MKIIPILLPGLFLALLSCNQNGKESNTEIKNSDTLIKSESPQKKNKNLVDELLKFVPANYSILDSARGDLNLDGLMDYILAVRVAGEDTLYDLTHDSPKRPLMILLQDSNNELKLAKRNENIVYCTNCGGVFGDPYSGITIKDGYFSVEHYGGSSWRWTRIITYKYSKEENEWFLHKDGSDSYHSSEPEKVTSKVKTTKDFGKVKFEDFDIYKE